MEIWGVFCLESFSILVILFVLKTDITNLLLGAFIIYNHISLFLKWICKIHLAIVGMEK